MSFWPCSQTCLLRSTRTPGPVQPIKSVESRSVLYRCHSLCLLAWAPCRHASIPSRASWHNSVSEKQILLEAVLARWFLWPINQVMLPPWPDNFKRKRERINNGLAQIFHRPFCDFAKEYVQCPDKLTRHPEYTAPRIRRRIRTWRSRGQSVAAAAARGHRHVRVPALFPRRRCWQDTATASAKLLGPSLDTNAASAQCSAWQHSAIPGVDARQARTDRGARIDTPRHRHHRWMPSCPPARHGRPFLELRIQRTCARACT